MDGDGDQCLDEASMMGHSSSGFIVKQQKMLSAKEELQKSKEQAINESKMFLSKRITELEKINKELDTQNTKIQNRLKMALNDKEQMKQQINQLKNQLKLTNEASRDINLRAAIK